MQIMKPILYLPLAAAGLLFACHRDKPAPRHLVKGTMASIQLEGAGNGVGSYYYVTPRAYDDPIMSINPYVKDYKGADAEYLIFRNNEHAHYNGPGYVDGVKVDTSVMKYYHGPYRIYLNKDLGVSCTDTFYNSAWQYYDEYYESLTLLELTDNTMRGAWSYYRTSTFDGMGHIYAEYKRVAP